MFFMFFCDVDSLFCPIQTTTLSLKICNLQCSLYIAGYLLRNKVSLMEYTRQKKNFFMLFKIFFMCFWLIFGR